MYFSEALLSGGLGLPHPSGSLTSPGSSLSGLGPSIASPYWSALSAVAKSESSVSPVPSTRSLDISPSSNTKKETKTPKVEGEAKKDRPRETDLSERSRTVENSSDSSKKSHKRSESGSSIVSPSKDSHQSAAASSMGHKDVTSVHVKTDANVSSDRVNGDAHKRKVDEGSDQASSHGVKLPSQSDSGHTSPVKKMSKVQDAVDVCTVDNKDRSKDKGGPETQDGALCLSVKHQPQVLKKQQLSPKSSEPAASSKIGDVKTQSISTTTTTTPTLSVSTSTTTLTPSTPSPKSSTVSSATASKTSPSTSAKSTGNYVTKLLLDIIANNANLDRYCFPSLHVL